MNEFFNYSSSVSRIIPTSPNHTNSKVSCHRINLNISVDTDSRIMSLKVMDISKNHKNAHCPIHFVKWTLKVTSAVWSRIILRTFWPWPLSKFRANMDLQTPYLFLPYVAIFSNIFLDLVGIVGNLETTQYFRLLRFSTSHSTSIIVCQNTMADELRRRSTYGLDIGLNATSRVLWRCS